MSSFLKISVRFLLDEFDGRGDGGGPEWPPSPLRLFQALTNSAARLGMETFAQSLEHLEKLPLPLIIASKPATIQPRSGFKTFVPNNVGDLVAKSWSSGRDNDIANYRAAKEIRPTRLPENSTVHYLWEITDSVPHAFVNQIQQLARSISAFGWGINMVVADADTVETNDLGHAPADSEKWLPAEVGGTTLRVPVSGTLTALEERYQAFLTRLPTAPDGSQYFQPVTPLESFRVATYRRESDLARPPYAVFALRKLDDSKFAVFDPQWRRLHLAGMLRHSASQDDFAKALGWDARRVKSFVLGHDPSDSNNSKPTANAPRLVFIPLPSVEWRDDCHAIGAIRRVLVTVNGNCAPAEFQRIVRALEGRELFDEKQQRPVAFLRRQSEKDGAIAAYISVESASAVWTSVTPVVLPGHDDPRKLRRRLAESNPSLSAEEKAQIVRKLDERIERLLRKALLEAGLPPQLVADANLEWRGTGFLPGVDLASRYSVPDQCRRFRQVHVRVTWREQAPDGTLRPKKIAGPLCLGSGRYSGLGLFVPADLAPGG
jgi:CRISPR-associated protein Csb2